jgi:Skp family chaperone for outer membrane proteins
VKTNRFPAALGALAAAALLIFQPAAVQAEDWFMPGQQHTNAPRSGRPPARVEHAPPPAAAPMQTNPVAAGEPAQPGATVQLPPIPQLPQLPRGPTPPAAVIGVLGVPEVMRASTAAQQVEKVLGARRDKLNQDAQKEQAAWRDMQQALGNDRAKLNPEQIRTREKELQERITNAQRQFRERNKIIQDAAQYALAQIERTLIAVIRQVSESRGMNLVLHRAQVALNVNEFDITQQVTEQLNKLLPSVDIPPDGQEPPVAKNAPKTAANPAPAPGAAVVNPVPAERSEAAEAPPQAPNAPPRK